MPIQNAQISTATITQFSGGDKSEASYGIVYSIILDETHPIIKNASNKKQNTPSTQNGDILRETLQPGQTKFSVVQNTSIQANSIGSSQNDNSSDTTTTANISLIGAIEFRYSNKPVSDDKNLPIAYPFDKNFKNLPVKNETVEIIKNNVGQVFYRRIGAEISPNVNTDGTYISSNYKPDSEGSNKKESYSKVNDTGISRTNVDDSTKYDGYGDYFKAQPKIHKLKLYEGDMLLESRFGQSIRFSGYNNPKKEFSPTIIIRNGENSVISQKDINFSIEEDISRDGSSIVLSSNQNQLAFLPGTIDDKGKTDFQTKPESFDGYPSKFIGDQILLNSGRIILSAKTAEMIFFSKKNYGFISDGAMSIDNKLGIDITVGDDINIMTNDRDINLITGNGSVFIGSKELEPMVKGQKLVDLLAELIDAITQQMYLTPSGPSASGPTNVAQFGSIKSKLNNILSKLNQTS